MNDQHTTRMHNTCAAPTTTRRAPRWHMLTKKMIVFVVDPHHVDKRGQAQVLALFVVAEELL
jgi:hypothetical protein